MIYFKDWKIAYICLGLVSILLMLRCFLSFDALDESYYIACIDRFWKGDCPIVDEWHPTQVFFLMQLPFYSLYRVFVANGEGVYLAFRFFSLFLSIVTSVIVCWHMLKYYHTLTAILSSLAVILFCRGNIQGISYYGVFVDAIVLSLICEEHRLRKNTDSILLGIPIGFFWCLTVCCMPFQIISFLPICLYYRKRRNKKTWIGILVGAGIVVIYIVLLLLATRTSIGAAWSNLPYLLMDEEHSVGYLKRLISTFVLTIKALTGFGCVIFCCMMLLVATGKHSFQIMIPLFLVGASFSTKCNIQYADRMYVIFVFYMIPIVLAILKKQNLEQNSIPLMYLLSGGLFALCFVSGSNMNIDAISTGMVLGSIGIFIALDAIEKKEKISYGTICRAFSIIMIMICLGQRMVVTANDLPINLMSHRVTNGVLKGIWVSDGFLNQYEKIQSDIHLVDVENSSPRVYLTDVPSWIYVEGHWRCSNSSTWGRVVLSDKMDNYYRLHENNYPEIIVESNRDEVPQQINRFLVPSYIIESFEKDGGKVINGQELTFYIRTER